LRITVDESNDCSDIEIIIKCQSVNEDLEKLISMIQLHSHTVIGKSEGQTFFLKLENILYFDTVDEKVFIYTTERVYETSMRLYEIEEMFKDTSVIRVNKSAILNLVKVDHVSPMLNGRIKAILDNGETLIISRQYVLNFKKKLGI
jgi:DNA-binding LytR/AlgR family response regulator